MPGELEVGGGDAAQDHALQATEIVEAVVVGGLDGREQGLAGILAGHAQELPQGQRRLQFAAALEALGVDALGRRRSGLAVEQHQQGIGERAGCRAARDVDVANARLHSVHARNEA